jgi:hypothetical protein
MWRAGGDGAVPAVRGGRRPPGAPAARAAVAGAGMKRGTPEHPKTLELVDALGCSHVEAVGVLELLWHFAAHYAPAGDVGRWSNARIAAGVHWPGDPDALVAALVKTRWLEESVPGRLRVHDWYTHADELVHHALARTARHFTTGEPPRLSRLPKWERDRLLALYDGKRLPSALKALSKRIAEPSLSQALAKPSLKNPLPIGSGRATSGELFAVPTPPPRRKPRCPVPDDFALTDALRAFAEAGGLDPAQELAAMRDHYRANGELRADWPATFREWCRRSLVFRERRARR